MSEDRKGIDEILWDVSRVLEAGPLWQNGVLSASPREAALGYVVRGLMRGKYAARCAFYCVVGAHPIDNSREAADRDLQLSRHFWRRWWQCPPHRRSHSQYLSPTDPGYWQWDNGDKDRTGEVAGGITLSADDAAALTKIVTRLALKSAGGRPRAYPHSRAAAAVAFQIMALPESERAKLTGPSVGALLKVWYDDQADLAAPDVTMLDKEGAEILAGFREQSPLKSG